MRQYDNTYFWLYPSLRYFEDWQLCGSTFSLFFFLFSFPFLSFFLLLPFYFHFQSLFFSPSQFTFALQRSIPFRVIRRALESHSGPPCVGLMKRVLIGESRKLLLVVSVSGCMPRGKAPITWLVPVGLSCTVIILVSIWRWFWGLGLHISIHSDSPAAS